MANDVLNPVGNPHQVQNYTTLDPQIVTKPTQNTSVVVTQNDNSLDNSFIRKKWTFQKFKRLIKKGSYTSARLAAKALGVDRRTILDWENRPEILNLLQQDVHEFTSKIRKNKDWKAQAYLLDKITDTEDKEDKTVNISNLIQVNTLQTPAKTPSG